MGIPQEHATREQIGLPLPVVPALLAVGALAAQGRISIPPVLGAISVAALATDLAWYELGRRRGARVLARLCQLSLGHRRLLLLNLSTVIHRNKRQ